MARPGMDTGGGGTPPPLLPCHTFTGRPVQGSAEKRSSEAQAQTGRQPL